MVVQESRLTYQGGCAKAATHRVPEQVFDHRLAIHPLAGQWVALPGVDRSAFNLHFAFTCFGLLSCCPAPCLQSRLG